MPIHFKALASAVLVASCFACTPMTDVVATNTEATGKYAIRLATVSGDAFTADVCLENPHHSDEVANRIVRQLLNHGYRTITLDMAAPSGSVGRFVWTQAGERREAGSATANACAPVPAE